MHPSYNSTKCINKSRLSLDIVYDSRIKLVTKRNEKSLLVKAFQREKIAFHRRRAILRLKTKYILFTFKYITKSISDVHRIFNTSFNNAHGITIKLSKIYISEATSYL